MSFHKNGYQIVKKFLHKSNLQFLQNFVSLMEYRCYKDKPSTKEKPYPYNDDMVEKCFSWYGGYHTDGLLMFCQDKISKIVKKNLVGSYSYHRTYYKDSDLEPHVDRESCEYSVSVCIKKEKEDWPLYFQSFKGKIIPVNLNEGDAVIYKGSILTHWREPLKGNEHTQFFLHYIDKDNIYYPTYMFDGRLNLGTRKEDDE